MNERRPNEIKEFKTKDSPEEKEYLPEYEVKISVSTTLDSLKLSYQQGDAIQFIVTDDLSIWLTDRGHLNLFSKDGLEFADLYYRGLTRKRDNQISFNFYERVDPKLEKIITETITNFLK